MSTPTMLETILKKPTTSLKNMVVSARNDQLLVVVHLKQIEATQENN